MSIKADSDKVSDDSGSITKIPDVGDCIINGFEMSKQDNKTNSHSVGEVPSLIVAPSPIAWQSFVLSGRATLEADPAGWICVRLRVICV